MPQGGTDAGVAMSRDGRYAILLCPLPNPLPEGEGAKLNERS